MVPRVLCLHNFECVALSIGASVFARGSSEVWLLRAILGREDNPVPGRIPAEIQVARARAIDDGQSPLKHPGALSIENLQTLAVLHVRVAAREVGPCHVVVAARNALGVIAIRGNTECDAGLEVASKLRVLESKGNRNDGLGCIGVVLWKDQVHFQSARGGLDNPRVSQKACSIAAQDTEGAREDIHGLTGGGRGKAVMENSEREKEG